MTWIQRIKSYIGFCPYVCRERIKYDFVHRRCFCSCRQAIFNEPLLVRLGLRLIDSPPLKFQTKWCYCVGCKQDFEAEFIKKIDEVEPSFEVSGLCSDCVDMLAEAQN